MQRESADQPSFEQIANWLSGELSVRRERIHPSTRIEDDLGCTGDDARDLMDAFARDFSVDLTGFDIRQHFAEEGSATPWSMAYALVRWATTGRSYESSPDPITVERLTAAAARGTWVEPDDQASVR